MYMFCTHLDFISASHILSCLYYSLIQEFCKGKAEAGVPWWQRSIAVLLPSASDLFQDQGPTGAGSPSVLGSSWIAWCFISKIPFRSFSLAAWIAHGVFH